MRGPRPLLAAPLAAAASLLLTTVVLAGGWAQVTITDPPSDVPVGSGSTIDFTVLQHGVTPVSWPRITVVATGPDGTVVHARAVPAGDAEGHYTANLTFPAGGKWSLAFESTDLIMEGTATLAIGPGVVPVAPAGPAVEPDTNPAPAPATPAASASGDATVTVLFGAIIVGLAAAFVALLLHERRGGSVANGAAARRVGS